MNYAIVKDGAVANIIVAEEAYAVKTGALPVYDGCVIGGKYAPPVAPTPEDDISAMLVDHELRLSLLEPGVEGGES